MTTNLKFENLSVEAQKILVENYGEIASELFPGRTALNGGVCYCGGLTYFLGDDEDSYTYKCSRCRKEECYSK